MPILALLAITIIWIEGTYTMARRHRVGSGVLSAAIGASLLVPVSTAEALPATIPASIVSSGCSRTLTYRESIGDGKFRGLYQGYKPQGARGTVKYCTYEYRLNDTDTSAAYFVGEMTQDWSKTSNADPFFGGRGGAWNVVLGSSLAAHDQVFDATPTYKKTVIMGCPSFTVGFAFIGIGLDLSQSLCGTQTVSRSSLSKWGATWANGTASEMKQEDLVFSEKVADKRVPQLMFIAARPAYSYSWTAIEQEDHGYYYRGWKPTQKRATLLWSATR